MRCFGMSNGMSGFGRRMTVSLLSVVGVSALSLGGVGCQNKVYDENVKLRDTAWPGMEPASRGSVPVPGHGPVPDESV